MKKYILTAIWAAAVLSAAAADDAMWLRDINISPDGKNIAFTYRGDIYTVAAGGGEAHRITSAPSYETAPIWSPDSRTIAFASDSYGNFDVFATRINGDGSWQRLTFNSAAEIPEAFTPDGKEVLFSAAIQDPVESVLFPSQRLTELYSVGFDGKAPRQILASPATAITWAPDGKSFLYQDIKGFEDTWRKHHTSSVTRDIWRFTPATGVHTPVVQQPGEDLNPVDAGDRIYFLSERKPHSSINVWSAPIDNPSAAEPVTSFAKHPVRFLSRAVDGTLAFGYDGSIYTLTPGAKPRKVDVDIKADYPDERRKLRSTTGAKEATASPDGKNVAFIWRGDVYVTPVEYGTTRRITSTPEAECDICWANDSTLYYCSEREGRYNIWRATSGTPGEKNLVYAPVIKEEPVFKADKHERTMPRMSPDGKTLAFILDRNILALSNPDGSKVHHLTDGKTNPRRDGHFDYSWSPDSRTIALEVVDRKHDPYTDIAIIDVATGKLTNITGSGYFDSMPRWIFDGNALAFQTERNGMRNHASWGSQSDIYFVFMNQKAFDSFKLSKEDRERLAADSDTNVVIETEGISDRQVRITPMSTDLVDGIVDGRKLHFISEANDGGTFVWEYDLDDKSLTMKRRSSDGSGVFEVTPDGKNIFFFGKTLQKFGSKPKTISYTAETTLDPAAERAFMFDNIAREEAQRFYTADMHGVDWPALTAHYRRFLPHISNNYDFAEMLSEMLGELNVSHTGARRQGSTGSSMPQSTASLGVLLDLNYTGEGARIAEVLPQGPLYGLEPPVMPGDVISAVGGSDVTVTMPLDVLLTDAADKPTYIELRRADGSRSTHTVKPVSASRMSAMLYDRWVRRRAHDVDSLSGGRLAYVHIPSMNDESFRKVYSDLLGKYNDREGVVIDIRWNGGGRLHEDIETLFSGEKYFTQEIRGNETCDMPSRRWNKPSIMIISEACYSNAHGTPWVYTHRGIGRTVGMPVPGTMTSVNWVRMQDPSLVYGIPVVGYRLPDGGFLENRQLEPDIKVANDPTEAVNGIDAQLRTAVDTLLKEIDSKK